MSPVSPPRTLPGVAQNRSQTLSPRPSSWAAPSIWYDAVAAPQRKSAGNASILAVDMAFLSGRGGGDVAARGLMGPRLHELRRRDGAGGNRERTAGDEAAAFAGIDGGRRSAP